MTSIEPRAPRSSSPSRPSSWVRELPFLLVLILTLAGVAYTTFAKQPIVVYWDVLAPIIGLVCVGAGWPNAHNGADRWRLIGTQALHWMAFILVMSVLLLPSVQREFNAGATGLAILTLLALGTFTGGVHVLSWQVCLVGIVMALAIPAVAFIENSALIFGLIAAAVLAIGAVVLWWMHQRRAQAAAPEERAAQ